MDAKLILNPEEMAVVREALGRYRELLTKKISNESLPESIRNAAALRRHDVKAIELAVERASKTTRGPR